MPTDSGLPITQGDLMSFPRDPIQCMRAIERAHGEISALDDGEQRLHFAFGPENNRIVQCDPRFFSHFFAIRGGKKSAQRRTTCGLLNMNGDTHRRHRRMAMGPFSKRSIPNYHPAVAELIEEMLDDWRIGEVRDLHADMTEFMLRVTSAILFGLSDRDLAYETGRLIDEWAHMNHETGMGVLISRPDITQRYGELLTHAEKLEKNIRLMIDRRRDDVPGNDVLSLLIQARDAEGGITDEELIGHVSLIFGAAHLTTAHSLTWTLFLLAQHPNVAREVTEEIKAAAFPTLVPQPDQARSLPALDRAVKESMRCLPASAYLQRMVAEPVDLGPFRLGRGQVVIFSQYMTHHMERLYPQANEFRPERWKTIDPSPYEYFPFGAGPRMCLGAMLALQTIVTTLPSILSRYRLAIVPDSQINGEVVSTMLGPKTSVPVEIHRADGRHECSYVHGNIHELVKLPTPAQPTRRAA